LDSRLEGSRCDGSLTLSLLEGSLEIDSRLEGSLVIVTAPL